VTASAGALPTIGAVFSSWSLYLLVASEPGFTIVALSHRDTAVQSVIQ